MATNRWIGTTNDWNVTGNWSLGAVPVATNDVVFENNSQSVAATLNQSAIALASLTIKQSYTGTIGVAPTATAAPTYLQVDAGTLVIGGHDGDVRPSGSQMLLLDLGSNAQVVRIYDSADQSNDSSKMPIRLLGTNSASTLEVFSGKVSIAQEWPTESAQFATIDVADSRSILLSTGAGVTLTKLRAAGGRTSVRAAGTTHEYYGGAHQVFGSSAMTTLESFGGELSTFGTFTISSANMNGGSLVSNSTGTISTFTFAMGVSHVAFSKIPSARTISALRWNGGAGTIVYNENVTVTSMLAPTGTRFTSG